MLIKVQYNIKRYVVLLCILTMYLSACSSSARLQIKQPLSANINSQRSAYINVISTVAKKEELTVRLQDALFSKFISRSIFKKVTPNAQEPVDYIVKVVISEAREVSGAARVWLGVFAGANRIVAEVTVLEKSRNKIVTTFTVSAASAMMPISTQDGLSDAVREASDKIIYGITNIIN